MRTDLELQQDVTNELRWDPSVLDEEIAVGARDGVVTLGGTVDSFAAKWAAVRAAERVTGVRAVADDVEVKLPGGSQRSDTELAHRVVSALQWDVIVPDDRIKARVEHGWVTLEGEVDWEFQRRTARRAIQNLTGVRGVTNLVALRKQASPLDVSQRIKDALRRQAELDATAIHVDAKDGTVTLRGSVHSWAELRKVEQAAWSAPGVTRVEDQLVLQR
ncbi:MAG: BON domain-containing protein [Gemmatirosa sp.]